jgi:anti-sigma factor ChrR (cupin superfamily)
VPNFDNEVIRAPIAGSRYLRSHNQDWKATGSQGFWLKRLYEDDERGEKTWLMKMDAGALSESHSHDEFEQFYVLDGSIQDDQGVLEVGDFVCREPGDMHAAGSEAGALVLLIYTRRDPRPRI